MSTPADRNRISQLVNDVTRNFATRGGCDRRGHAALRQHGSVICNDRRNGDLRPKFCDGVDVEDVVLAVLEAIND
jgi:hypothetical protein